MHAPKSAGHDREDTSSLLGSLLVSGLVSRAYRRPLEAPPFFLYLDEFQNVVSLSLVNALSELRKYGLGLTLAHQHLGQLGEALRASVLGNVGTLVLFRIGAEDAQHLRIEFMPEFDALDLSRLPNYEMYLRVLAAGEASQPFSARSIHHILYDAPHATSFGGASSRALC